MSWRPWRVVDARTVYGKFCFVSVFNTPNLLKFNVAVAVGDRAQSVCPMTTADEPLLSADAIFERTAKPQALAALWSATEQQSGGELTLPPALPSHMQLPPPPPGDPPWVGRVDTSSMPVRARLSPMPAISPWSPSPLQTAPIAGGALRPLAPITVPVPAAVPHAVPVALPTTVLDHIPANGTTAALGSANGGGNARPVFSPAVTPPFDRPHGLAHGSGMEPARLPDEASLRLFVATWNMHGKAPPASLVPWLPASPDEHDMYVIGTQEAERSIEKSLIISSKAKWEAALRAHFGDGFVLLSVCPSRPSPASTTALCPGSTSLHPSITPPKPRHTRVGRNAGSARARPAHPHAETQCASVVA